MLIDVSYFIAGPRHVLNATLGSKANEVNVAVENIIAYHQPTFLCELFGEQFGRRLNAYFDSAEEEDDNYEAIRVQIAQAFADYVFFHILKVNTQATVNGLVRLKSTNEYTDPIGRQVAVWNGMVKRLRLFRGWCSERDITINAGTELLIPINIFNL